MKVKFLLIFGVFHFLCPLAIAQEVKMQELVEMSFEELLKVEVISASLKSEKLIDAPSNITVITSEMIENRGYQSLVEICEDLPGFDFLIFEDGGGEYSTFNMNRGIGFYGNEKILVMVDGIIQNNISLNWTVLWTFENLFHDLDRIEIIEGPGSAIYGAQAYSGVIHFITKSKINEVLVMPFYGSNSARGVDGFLGKQLADDIHLSAAFHKYSTDGDGGARYDPGNYFHNLRYPETVSKDYDSNGNYVTNVPHPLGGERIPDGFQNWHDSFSLRTKLQIKDTEIGGFLWDNYRGSGSYVTGYEYTVTDPEHSSHQRGYHMYAKNNSDIKENISLESNVVYRATHVLPRTGTQYHWRFVGMTKNWVGYSYQGYVEERLTYKKSDKTDFLLGMKLMSSAKSQRLTSLDYYPDNMSRTESDWFAADAGNGLGKTESVPLINVREIAAYGLWNNKWTDEVSSSVGLRFDGSSEYGRILNPRLALIVKPNEKIGMKALMGTAYRQPSIFELTAAWYRNPDLDAEKIATYEFELNTRLTQKINIRTNVFYSFLSDFIGMVPDVSRPGGQSYSNTSKSRISGLSLVADYQPAQKIRLFSNYMFTQAKAEDSNSWQQIDRSARHKINAGVNWALFENKLNLNLRMNYVGRRKAPETNAWLQKYENGYAPSYKKFNLALTYRGHKYTELQLIVKNLLDEDFYGISRGSGSGMIDDYDYQTNPNPSGFLPAYHPQPGRTIRFNLKIKYNEF